MTTAIISRPWYAVWDANGNETGDVRWLRIGSGRWYIEAGKWGIAARFDSLHFTAHHDAASEEAA